MKKLLLFAIPVVLIFNGCSTSKITTSWNEQQQTPVHFKKIVIVGLFDDQNRALRQQMEDQLVQELKEDGYNAVTSMSLFGPKSFENLSKEQALKEVRSKDIDGAITIGLVDTSKQKTFVPNYGYRPYGGWALSPWDMYIVLTMHRAFAGTMKPILITPLKQISMMFATND